MNIFSEEFIAGFRDGHDHGYAAGYVDARKEIEDAASVWHRVEEKPKEAGKYFVIWENNGYRGGGAALFSLRLGWIWGGPKITYWMPIEPPKEV